MKFSGHETFPLRFGWLTKGFQSLVSNPKVFEQEDATVTLGVGKNMVRAIRYWLLASRVAQMKGRALIPSEIGRSLFSNKGWDPYLEDEATIWLIHWLLASNIEEATSIYWFFNKFHKPEFTSGEVTSSLKEYSQKQNDIHVSDSTLRQDSTLILRMYAQSTNERNVPVEESLDSPLSMLNLIVRLDGKRYFSKKEDRPSIPPGIMGFAVAEVMEKTRRNSLPIDVLLNGDDSLPAPGSVFRLTENDLVTKLEELVVWAPRIFEIRETAGLHQIYQLQSIRAIDLLGGYYQGFAQRRVS